MASAFRAALKDSVGCSVHWTSETLVDVLRVHGAYQTTLSFNAAANADTERLQGHELLPKWCCFKSLVARLAVVVAAVVVLGTATIAAAA